MPWAGNVNHVEIVLFNDAIQMDIQKIEPWSCPPMAQQPGFDMFQCQRFFEQRIVIQIDLTDR